MQTPPAQVSPPSAACPPHHFGGEDEISLREIAAALQRRKWLVAWSAAILTLIGLLYAVFTQPLYTAEITVRPVSESSGDTLRV